jgi:hypothetical protein
MDKGTLTVIFAVVILLFMLISQWENLVEVDWRRLLLIGGGVCLLFFGVFMASTGNITVGMLLIFGGGAGSFAGFAWGKFL